MYNIVFSNSDRLPDQLWLSNPKVGDVVKVNMLTDDELESWIIEDITDNTITLRQL